MVTVVEHPDSPMEMVTRPAPNFPTAPTRDPVPWVKDEPAATEFMHALSLLFPEGETMFVKSVLHYLPRLVDKGNSDSPAARHIRMFVAQEYRHAALHERYNKEIVGEQFGHDVEAIQAAVAARLKFEHSSFSHEFQLATTCALEHFTAMMAHFLLGTARGREYLGMFDPFHRKVWTWHAKEEMEHKVCGSYWVRTLSMIRTTAIFILCIILIYLKLLWGRGLLFKPATWWASFKLLLVRPGLLPSLVVPWLDYFRPGFHPWDQNDNTLINGSTDPEMETVPSRL